MQAGRLCSSTGVPPSVEVPTPSTHSPPFPLTPLPPACPFPLPAENLENLILNIAQCYSPACKNMDFTAAEPEMFPDVGLWHPLASSMYEDLKEYLNW